MLATGTSIDLTSTEDFNSMASANCWTQRWRSSTHSSTTWSPKGPCVSGIARSPYLHPTDLVRTGSRVNSGTANRIRQHWLRQDRLVTLPSHTSPGRRLQGVHPPERSPPNTRRHPPRKRLRTESIFGREACCSVPPAQFRTCLLSARLLSCSITWTAVARANSGIRWYWTPAAGS